MGMKQSWIRWMTVLLAMLLVCGCASAEETKEAAETEKVKGIPQVNLSTFFSWYFSTDMLPEGSSLAENSLRIDSLYPATPENGEDGKEKQAEKVIAANVTWKAGSYYLVNAIRASIDNEGAEISLDPARMKWTGSTTFTITLESEHYRFETERSLMVVDPAKIPIFTQTLFNPVFNITLGTRFSAQELLGNIITVDYPSFCQTYGLPYPDAEVNVAEAETPGLTRDEDTGVLTLEDYGVFDLKLDLRIANLKWVVPFRIEAEPYSITGPGFVMPGSTARYRAVDQDAAAGRRYTWSAEGDGVTIDPKDGTLTVTNEAKTDTYIKVQLNPDKDPAISTSVLVPGGALPDTLYLMHEPVTAEESGEATTEQQAPAPLTEREAGFAVAVPEGENWRTGISANRQDGWIFRCVATGTGGATVVVDARTDQIYTGFREDDLAAMSYYNENSFSNAVKNLQSRDIRIDGHLAREYLFTVTDQNGQATHYGQICYCRNNQALTVRVLTTRQGAGADSLVPVTMKDLERIADGIRYEPDGSVIRREDAQLTLTTEEEKDFLVAGGHLQIIAEFANKDLINKDRKNNGIIWQIRDAETGEATDVASVNENDMLVLKRSLEKMTKLEVTAVSETFSTKASLVITACPSTRELSVEPAEICWFKNKDNQTVTVKAMITPDDIPLNLLTWTAFDGTRVEVTPSDDGTAVLTCLGEGNNSVRVTAPDGRKTAVMIRTVSAVESVKMKRQGKLTPGTMVIYTPIFTPATGILKDVKWTLDVGEETATIDGRGHLSINPQAVSGTVITVTCQALGAPEKVIATDQFTVE